MSKYTIKDLSEGRVAVINNGTLAELSSVLKAAFPKDNFIVSGQSKFYRKLRNQNEWGSENENTLNLPTQSVADFLAAPTEAKNEDKEDALWYEVKEIFMEAMDAHKSPEYAVRVLKSKYTINKK